MVSVNGHGSRNGRHNGIPRKRQPVRIAVVGLGYWGPNLVRVLHEIDEAEVLAACDVNEAALAKIACRYPAVRRTTSFEDVLLDDGVEAVAIVTPVSTHFDLALAALEAGKHVFVEKPMAGSVTEAETLIAIAEKRGLTLMPGHTFLYSPPVDIVRRLVRSGELGDIYFISTSRVNLGLHQPDVSVISDLGPHDFSILRYWLEVSPTQISAITRNCIMPGLPDVAFVNIQYECGTVAHVELSWLAPSKLRRTTIVGSRKMVVYDDTSNEPVRIFDSGVELPDPTSYGEYKLTYRTGDIVSPRVDPVEPLGLEMRDFCRSLRTDQEPRSSVKLGLEVVQIIDVAEKSLLMNGAPVFFAPAYRTGSTVTQGPPTPPLGASRRTHEGRSRAPEA
jgi:predicted dehydrogenase